MKTLLSYVYDTLGWALVFSPVFYIIVAMWRAGL